MDLSSFEQWSIHIILTLCCLINRPQIFLDGSSNYFVTQSEHNRPEQSSHNNSHTKLSHHETSNNSQINHQIISSTQWELYSLEQSPHNGSPIILILSCLMMRAQIILDQSSNYFITQWELYGLERSSYYVCLMVRPQIVIEHISSHNGSSISRAI